MYGKPVLLHTLHHPLQTSFQLQELTAEEETNLSTTPNIPADFPPTVSFLQELAAAVEWDEEDMCSPNGSLHEELTQLVRRAMLFPNKHKLFWLLSLTNSHGHSPDQQTKDSSQGRSFLIGAPKC